MMGSAKFGFLLHLILLHGMLTSASGSSRWKNVGYRRLILKDKIFGVFLIQDFYVNNIVFCFLSCQNTAECKLFGYNQSERRCRLHSSGFFEKRHGYATPGWDNYLFGDPRCVLNDGFVHVRTSDLCFHLSPVTANINKARQYCSDRNSTLVLLPSKAKAAAFDYVLRTYLSAVVGTLFIGLTKVEGKWTWEDGSRLTDAQWIWGQPFCPSEPCNCALKYRRSGYRYGDEQCGIVRQFACEIEIL